jgi:DNA-binding NtrC family response regulator
MTSVGSETLDSGRPTGPVPPGAESYPAALIRIGLLTSFEEDTAALLPIGGPAGEPVLRVMFTRGSENAVSRVGTVLTVTCADPWMSSQHASLWCAGERYRLVDEGSRNGVIFGDERVSEHVLEHNDIFVLGRTAWLFHGRPFLRDAVAAADRPFGPTRSVSPALLEQILVLERCAASDLTISIQGDTGTGKEVIAREVHRRSGRTGPFVAVNCAALPEALVEGQLFGHRRGAFTGAVESTTGLVAAAAGGTLFLDEILDMPVVAQAKLLRVLEDRAVLPLGETVPRRVDLRVLAASQRPLRDEANAGRFRRDLLARLGQVTVTLPPLQDRKGDLGVLVPHACREFRARLTLDTAQALLAYDWPLNLRELASTIRAAAVLAGADRPIDLSHLPFARLALSANTPAVTSAPTPLAATVPDETVETDAGGGGNAPSHEELAALLRRHRGNVTAAAREIGKGKMQLYRWMSRRGIDPRSYR